MKKLVLLIALSLSISACKDDKKSPNTEPVMKEVAPKENIVSKPLITINDYLNSYDNFKIKSHNYTLGELFSIESVTFFQEKETKDVYLVLKSSEELKSEIIGTYKIIARTFPEYKEDVRKENLERNLEFDSWYITPKQLNVNDDFFIISKLTNDVNYYKKVILQQINLKTKDISPVKLTIIDELDFF